MPGQYVWWYWDPQRNFGRWLQSDLEGVEEPIPGDGQWVFGALTAKQPWLEGLVLALGLRYAMRLAQALNMTRFGTALASGHNVYSGPVQLDGKSYQQIVAQLEDPDNLNLILPSGGADNKWDVKWTGPDNTGAKEFFLGALEEHGMECAEAVLGGNLTTETKKGSFAAAKVQSLVRQDLLEYDATVEDALANSQVLPAIAAINVGRADLAPWVETVAEPATDVFMRAKALADLARFLQLAPKGVDVRALLENYDVPLLPEAEDDPDSVVVPEPPAASAAAPSTAAGQRRLRPV
jgi:hypothetical protein